MPEISIIPQRPPYGSGTAVYDNTTGITNDEVIDALSHNQRMYATHHSLVFRGSIYCYIEPDGTALWCEEVWVGMEPVERFRATNIDDLIFHVNEKYGEI